VLLAGPLFSEDNGPVADVELGAVVADSKPQRVAERMAEPFNRLSRPEARAGI
jgi:hypothetical protein